MNPRRHPPGKKGSSKNRCRGGRAARVFGFLPGDIRLGIFFSGSITMAAKAEKKKKSVVPNNAPYDKAGKKIKENMPEILPLLKLYEGGVPYFLGASSSKVVKSQKVSEPWANVILYHSPADRAMLSFIHYFGEDMVRTLFDMVRKAAVDYPEWKDFARYRSTTFEQYLRQYRAVKKSLRKNFKLPDSRNKIGPLTLCPYATDDCRAVCLNTTGYGGMGKLDKDLARKEFLSKNKTDLPEGMTLNDELKYFVIHDVNVGSSLGKAPEPYYGAEQNVAQAARTKRTHIMWLAWAKQGPIRNFYNDILFEEIKYYASRKDGYPVAVRLNGTSDIPIHTLQLSDGRNLVETAGRELGVIFYDYTKSYTRMKDWLSAQPAGKGKWDFANKKGAKTKMLSVKGKSPFPSNYHLSFSYSEWNYKAALQVLSKGGNIVMVFAPSKRGDLKQWQEGWDKKQGKWLKEWIEKWPLPDLYDMASLMPAGSRKRTLVPVIDGDVTDIRFGDPFRAGAGGSGFIVGLRLKGEALGTDYTESDRNRLWNRFVQVISKKTFDERIIAISRKNPPAGGAAAGVDPDLLRATIDKEGEYYIAPTSVGT